MKARVSQPATDNADCAVVALVAIMSFVDIEFEEALGFLARQASERRDTGNARTAAAPADVGEPLLDIGFASELCKCAIGHAVVHQNADQGLQKAQYGRAQG